MTEVLLNKQYPIFLCKVEKDKLVTTFDWQRTALQGDKFCMMSSLDNKYKRKFYKDVYYKNEDGELLKISDKENVNLCINSETLFGQDVIECIDFNGEGIEQLGIE